MALLDHINLDFQVLSTGDPKILVVIDTSVWGAIEDKPAIIEITPPGTTKVRIYNFVKGKSNVFNSSNLLISPIGEYKYLVDGIYRVSVKGSPDTHCKHRDFLKTDKARLELAKIYVSLGFEDDDKTKKKKQTIQDIDLLIRAAEASVSIGKLKKGIAYFKRVVQYLKEYNDCETCK
jgi:hypothetical protein